MRGLWIHQISSLWLLNAAGALADTALVDLKMWLFTEGGEMKSSPVDSSVPMARLVPGAASGSVAAARCPLILASNQRVAACTYIFLFLGSLVSRLVVSLGAGLAKFRVAVQRYLTARSPFHASDFPHA